MDIIENPEFGVGSSTLSVSSTDVIISGFGGHIDIFGCWSLLDLLVETIFHLYPRFVVGILTILFTVSEI